MRIFKLQDMIKGWFVGDFEPTALRTPAVEVAVKEYAEGCKEEKHYHKIATEITVIIRGVARVNDVVLKEGDVVLLAPGEVAEFETLEPTITVVVKIPGANDDKHVLGQSNE